jgi:hypothetical protein
MPVVPPSLLLQDYGDACSARAASSLVRVEVRYQIGAPLMSDDLATGIFHDVDCGGEEQARVPTGPPLLCGGGRGGWLTASQTRTHFTICAKRPAASGDAERGGRTRTPSADNRRAANVVRLALRHRSRGLRRIRLTSWQVGTLIADHD